VRALAILSGLAAVALLVHPYLLVPVCVAAVVWARGGLRLLLLDGSDA
jgi:hypothetical protein